MSSRTHDVKKYFNRYEVPSKAWLSNGVELLFERRGLNKDGSPFDIIIIGSGYGGAIAASELSKLGLSICVLERGREFLPGSFPTSMNEAPTEFRISAASGSKPRGNLEGLIDVRLGKDLNVVQANGLGGGSLINAGVMARAKEQRFDGTRWPTEINSETLAPYYHDAEILLGSKQHDENGDLQANTIRRHEIFNNHASGLAKYDSLKSLSLAAIQVAEYPSSSQQDIFKDANITVNMASGSKTSAGLALNACNLCGDCASGCNNNSKISLDKNLLLEAARNGAEIFTGATALKFRASAEQGWLVDLVYTDTQLRSRQSQAYLTVPASKLIISAGSLGSTEILKRSQSDKLLFSEKLGEQFSSNGDMLAVGFKQNKLANAISNPKVPHSQRHVGPTITGMIDLRDQPDPTQQIVIQEMAVPATASSFFEEFYSTVNTIQTLWDSDKTIHKNGSDFYDTSALNPESLKHTSLYAIMGDDGAAGSLSLESNYSSNHEGTIQIDWPMLKEHPLFDNQIEYLESLSENSISQLGGTVLPNPVWRIVKPDLTDMMNIEKGPPLTVHPLGGCPMGSSISDGVVNHLGQAFKPITTEDSSDTHKGLIVLDGAIIPEAVGINPALTISAVSLRAIRELIKQDYFSCAAIISNRINPVARHPSYFETVPVTRSIEQLEASASAEETNTEIQITERLVGFSKIENDEGNLLDVVMELTLWSKPISMDTLSKKSNSLKIAPVVLEVDEAAWNEISDQPKSKLRLYYRKDWENIRCGKISVDEHEITLDNAAKLIAQITGNLTAFGRAKSNPVSRVTKAGWAWCLNRGFRDVYQDIKPTEWELSAAGSKGENFFKKKWGNRFLNLVRSLTRSGEIRTLNYDLKLSKGIKVEDFSYFSPSNEDTNLTKEKRIRGVKKFTYKRKANPWLQLSEVSLTQLPQKHDDYNDRSSSLKNIHTRTKAAKVQKKLKERGNILALDTNYITKAGIPLVRLTKQDNQFKALADLASFMGYFTRTLLGVHFYSFRAPELPKARESVRAAGKVSGLPSPTVHRIVVDTIQDKRVRSLDKGTDVEIVLTHFAHGESTKPPVMMLHGYSGNSVFFAHSSTPNNLTKFFHDDQRDVWLVDLRTSSALATAIYPWSFESVSDIDIPRAISHVYDYYHGKTKIDMVTHCMGSVMLGMSILRPNTDDADFFRNRINRIVMSQATPTVVFTPDSNFRSFATSYLRELIPDDYQFQIKEGEKSGLLLDRVLSTLPYPTKEFNVVNKPFKPSNRSEYNRTRHRVDALFSRTFEVNNLNKETLDNIDDIFGPIHVDTIVQASRFAHNGVATDAQGGNNYVSRERLQKYWMGIPTMSFHSRRNGLIDYSTGARTQRIFHEAGLSYKKIIIDDEAYGHQDALIGMRAHLDVFPHIANFLNGESPADPDTYCEKIDSPQHGWVVEAPTLGPIIVESNLNSQIKIMLGSNPARACQALCIFVPVTFTDKKLQLVGVNRLEKMQILKYYISQSLEFQGHISGELGSRWLILDIPKTLLRTPSAASTSHMEGIAALMIYDDLLELTDRFAIGNECKPQPFSNIAKKHEPIIDRVELQSVITKVVDDFMQSDLNTHYEFKNAVIEYSALPMEYDGSTTDQLTKKGELTFALGSCQYPAGILDKKLAYHSYQLLDEHLTSESEQTLNFIALVGDQIYADATAGFLDPSTKFDLYELPYYRLYENKHVRSVLRKLPVYAMLDDHELTENWEPVTNDIERQEELDEAYSCGVKSFLKFQRGVVSDPDGNLKHGLRVPLWYSFNQGGHDFFMCDTRTDRSARTAESILSPETTIISAAQESDLRSWLSSTQKDRTRFILSGSIFLPRHRLDHSSENSMANSLRSDSWDGYPVSLNKLLALLVDQELENIVFLSGDEHFGCYARIKVSNLTTGKFIHTVSAHCPGLYTPFPFANSREDYFEGTFDEVENEYISRFNFVNNNTQYQCEVKTRFNLDNREVRLGPITLKRCGGFLIVGASVQNG